MSNIIKTRLNLGEFVYTMHENKIEKAIVYLIYANVEQIYSNPEYELSIQYHIMFCDKKLDNKHITIYNCKDSQLFKTKQELLDAL